MASCTKAHYDIARREQSDDGEMKATARMNVLTRPKARSRLGALEAGDDIGHGLEER